MDMGVPNVPKSAKFRVSRPTGATHASTNDAVPSPSDYPSINPSRLSTPSPVVDRNLH